MEATRRRQTADEVLPHPPAHYWELARRPLHALVFLLPLIVFYELGAALWLQGVSLTAHRYLHTTFNALGITGLFLPGIIVVVVLSVWHLVRKDPWRLEPRVYAFMAGESLLLACPLVVFSLLLPGAVTAIIEPGALAGAAVQPGASVPMGPTLAPDQALGLRHAILLSIGAGIYEELVFRMIGIAVLHMLLVDLAGLKSSVGFFLAIAITSVLFGWFHFTPENPFDWGLMLFYTVAGLYLAVIYTLRGFGIVAGAHALYDALILVVLPTLFW